MNFWVKVPDCTLPCFRVGNYLRVGGCYGVPLSIMLISDARPRVAGPFVTGDDICLSPFGQESFDEYAKREPEEAAFMLRDLAQGFVTVRDLNPPPDTNIAGIVAEKL